jgi:nucleoside-diphosphate kinase
MIDHTLLLIKPDAIRKNFRDEIIKEVMGIGLQTRTRNEIHLTIYQAQQLYKLHMTENFFDQLISFMTSGPSEVLILTGEDAVRRVNELCGHNNPKMAKPGTLRHTYGTGKSENAVHSSSSHEDFCFEYSLLIGGVYLPSSP